MNREKISFKLMCLIYGSSAQFAIYAARWYHSAMQSSKVVALFMLAIVGILGVLVFSDSGKKDKKSAISTGMPPRGMKTELASSVEDLVDKLEDRLFTLADRIRFMCGSDCDFVFVPGYSGEPILSPPPENCKRSALVSNSIAVTDWSNETPAKPISQEEALTLFYAGTRSVYDVTFKTLEAKSEGGVLKGTIRIHVDSITNEGAQSERVEIYGFEASGEDCAIRKLNRLEGKIHTANVPPFVEVSKSAGVDLPEFVSRLLKDELFMAVGGVAAGDLNGDGFPEIVLPGPEKNFIFRNDGGRFTDISDSIPDLNRIAGLGGSAIIFDYDNDGVLDVLIIRELLPPVKIPSGSFLLLKNLGNLKFKDVSQEAGLTQRGPSTSACAADIDNDGDMDLFVCMYKDFEGNSQYAVSPDRILEARNGSEDLLFLNNGSGTFTEMGEKAGVANKGWGLACAFSDFDGDGFPDLYVVNDFGPNNFYRNNGNRTFKDVTKETGTADPGFGMGVSWGDANNDGRLDMYISNMYSTAANRVFNHSQPRTQDKTLLMKAARGNSLFIAGAEGKFDDATDDAGVGKAGWAWGGQFFDADNDGWLDIYVPNGYYTGISRRDF